MEQNQVDENLIEQCPIKEKKRNIWKILFFVLLGMLILGIISFIWGITRSIDNPRSLPQQEENVSETPSFQVQMTTSQLNTLVQDYIANKMNEKAQGSSLGYEVQIDEEIIVKGSYKIFGFDIEFSMPFEPSVLNNGNIYLKAEKLKVGMFDISAEYVLDLIDVSGVLPKTSEIDLGNEGILINVNAIETSQGIKFQVKEMDLKNDNIVIDVILTESIY